MAPDKTPKNKTPENRTPESESPENEIPEWEKLKAGTVPLKRRPEAPPPPRLKRLEPGRFPREIPPPSRISGTLAPYPFLEPKQSRKLARGQTEIDRTVDLHGMTEDAAYRCLLREIPGAASMGARLILIITGRGVKPLPQVGPDRAEFRSRDDFPKETGVLKSRLPEWLSAPALAPFIVSYEEAHPRHGGAGATYARLRKPGT